MSAEPESAARAGTRAGGERAAVRVRDGAVRLGGRTIWSGVDVSVEPGQFVAILGPNGAGKSTLVNVLLGLVALAGGRASVLGEPPGRPNARIGYLPQRRSLGTANRVRGREIVRLGLDGDRWGVPLPFPRARRREAARRVGQTIELVGAQDYADRPIGELSGGEQQRLLIAQALVRRPHMLILDEPLDSLDLANQRAVAALVQRICREQGVTVLLVAHDVNPLIGYLDQVVYLAGGSAVAGATAEVVTSETLSRLYGVPVEVLRASDGRLVVVGSPDETAHHHNHHAH